MHRIPLVLNILAAALLMFPSGLSAKKNFHQQKISGPSFEEVAAHIQKTGNLPDNYITKKEAKKLGWIAKKGNLDDVAPGKSIGGDIFGNREKKLPEKKGRIWREADIHYSGGKRGKYRILYSNDGLIFKTEDHYKTFQRIGK